ncbi:MAG: metallophosphoesterase [Planctomycetota bacterium]|nr:metallophosphoesterase [Planctomycetota bacterium]
MNKGFCRRLMGTFLVLLAIGAGVQGQDNPPGSSSSDGLDSDGKSAGKAIESSEVEAAPVEIESSQEAEGRAKATLKAASASSKREPPSAVVREPSQGRPIFIMPDETFYFVMRLPADLQGDVRFALVHALEPTIRVTLYTETPPSYVNDEYCTLVLKVPSSAQPGLYDLEVRSATGQHFSRRCVKVVNSFKDRFRFVHLSDMNVGDLTAPDFDEMLPNEINLLAPEFIIATGDYTEWARARNDASSWNRVLKFFEKFNAPVFMICGLHDHEASFTRFVASNPIGKLDYGAYHGLLLLDHAGNPIDQDFSQLQWVDADLKRNRNKRFNFIVTNSHELALLDIWRERGGAAEFVREHKIRMMIVGGATDWDYKEFADKLAGLDDMILIRTHQSSTCMRDRATGFSHYRVIEIDGDRVDYIYPDDNAVDKLAHSIPTGRLRVFLDAPNDGSADRVGATVQNALNRPFENVHVWLRVAKRGDKKPIVAPGTLVRAMDVGSYWACDVAFDLPDKGAVRIVASTGSSDVPPPLPITVGIEGPSEWRFSSRTTDFGMTYFHSDAEVSVKLTNRAKEAVTCWPVIRVNGSKIHPTRSACPRLPITLQPSESISLPLVLNLRRVSPGPHVLQVYFLEDPLTRLSTFNVTLAHGS